MAKTWSHVLYEKGDDWGVEAAERAKFDELWEAASTALIIAMTNERTDAIDTQIRGAFASLLDFMKLLKKQAFISPPLIYPDYVSLLLSPPDKRFIPAPTAQVEADISFPGKNLVELTNIRPVSGDHSPRMLSSYGVRIFWGLTGPETGTNSPRITTPPEKGSDLPHSRYTRRQRELFNFDGEQGSTVYFCMRYENQEGNEGPFGPILNAVIP